MSKGDKSMLHTGGVFNITGWKRQQEVLMCGRFTITLDPGDLREELAIAEVPPDWRPRYNAAPTQLVGAVTDADARKMEWFRWGLIPFWARDMSIGNRMINARAETIMEKPSFRQAFQKRRCIIPADGFFEWRKSAEGKTPSTPYYITLKEREPFAFAGLWETWRNPEGEEILSCTIITTAANELMLPIHDRMPVILPKEVCWQWLQPAPQHELVQMLRPLDPALMQAVVVGRSVNNPGFDSPENIVPQAG
jgi:putative SOS response-associated peptidase YedK